MLCSWLQLMSNPFTDCRCRHRTHIKQGTNFMTVPLSFLLATNDAGSWVAPPPMPHLCAREDEVSISMDMFPRSSRSGIPAAKPSRSTRKGLHNKPIFGRPTATKLYLGLVPEGSGVSREAVRQRPALASCNCDSFRTRVARRRLCTGGVWLLPWREVASGSVMRRLLQNARRRFSRFPAT